MEVFAYNPDAKNETLDAFNERIAAFCSENPAIGIDVSLLGNAILLSLTLAEDAEIETAAAVIPRVVAIDPAQALTLEKTLGDEIASITALDTDDNPSLPFKATLHETKSGLGYAVILIDGGEISLEEDAPEEPAPRQGGRRG